MKYLRWFYISVQFVMLAVSIPKVATLFHAYDPNPFGPTIGGLDLTSWMVGIVVDLCTAVTTLAALNKYGESHRRIGVVPSAMIVAVCTTISVISNYEDAATMTPSQYAHIALFSHPALLINPLVICTPPVIVLMLIILVPSVLAKPRLRMVEEIEAATQEQELLIAAKGRLKRIQAEENAKVRQARVRGFMATVDAIGTEPVQAPVAAPVATVEADLEPEPDDDPDPPDPEPTPAPPQLSLIPMPAVKMTRPCGRQCRSRNGCSRVA